MKESNCKTNQYKLGLNVRHIKIDIFAKFKRKFVLQVQSHFIFW